jgi:hypothetical protein
MNLMLTRVSIAAMVLTILPVIARADEAAYKPAGTTIAVLPATNVSSDKWEDVKKQEAAEARKVVLAMFVERGFQTVAPEKVDEAVTKLNLDLKNEEQWGKTTCFKVGKEVNADLVAFVLIKQTRQKSEFNILIGKQFNGEAEIEIWLVDVKQEKALLNGASARGLAKGGVRGATTRRLAAVKFAVDKGLKDFLKPYPKTDKPDKKDETDKTDKSDKKEK